MESSPPPNPKGRSGARSPSRYKEEKATVDSKGKRWNESGRWERERQARERERPGGERPYSRMAQGQWKQG